MSVSDLAQRPVESRCAEAKERITFEQEAEELPGRGICGTGFSGAGLPRNAETGRRISGIDVLIPGQTRARRGSWSERRVNYGQARDIGGYVRKVAGGATIFHGVRVMPKGNDHAKSPLDVAEQRHVTFLERLTVRKLGQCKGKGAGQ